MYTAWLEAVDSGVTVVTVNKRLARTLRTACNERQAALGNTAWRSPDIISWSAWLQRLWQESRLRGGAGRGKVLLSDSAAGFVWQSVIRATDEAAGARRPAHLARQAQRTWSRLQEWQGLTADEWVRPDLSPDQKAWLRWSGAFRDRCRDTGRIDPESLPALLTADIEAGVFDDLPSLLFAGFDDWTPARRALLDALRMRGVKAVQAAAADTAGAVTLQSAASADTEIAAAAAWARAQLEAAPGNRIGVVVPDLAARATAVRRAFLDALVPRWRLDGVPAGLPLNVSYGEPLARVPAVATALIILGMLQGRTTFNDFSLLLRSPWIAGADDEQAARAALDIRLREKLRVEFSLATTLPLCRDRAPQFARLLEAVEQCGQRRGAQTSAGWAHEFTALLQEAGWPGNEALDSERWQMVQAWNELLRDFAGSGRVLGPLPVSSAVTVLTFQAEGVDHGIQVLGVLEAAGHQFDALRICGMARETWPAAAKPDPFIPLELQRRLGMPEASAARSLEHATVLARRLQCSAPEVIVSWPAQADGEALSPTRLFTGAVLADADTAASSAAGWNAQALAGGATVLVEHDPPPPWHGSDRVRGGASVLSRQAVSPLNAFIQNRLGAFEMERPVVAITAMARGNLTHHALEAFYTAFPASAAAAALAPAEREALLRDALQAALADLPGCREPFMQRVAALETEQQLRRLQAFLDLDLAREPFTVEEREEKHDVTIGRLRLRLKLDRLDRDVAGRRFVIDYKTGGVNRQHWNPDRPRDLQLPLYVTAVAPDAAAVAFAQVSTLGIGYDGVGSGEILLDGLRTPGTQQRTQVRYQYPHTDEVIESWGALTRIWGEVLAKLAADFAAGDYRFDPRNPDSARGQYAVLSRVFDAGLSLTEDAE